MVRPSSRLLVAAAAWLAAAVSPLQAVAIAETPGWALENFALNVRNYNVVTLGGGATFTNFGTTQGPLAIDGNLSLAGGTLANSPALYGATSDPTLYVTGKLTTSGATTLANGLASLPGETAADYTWSSGTKTLSAVNHSGSLIESGSSANPLTNPAPANFNWSDVVASLQQSSDTLAGLATSGTISVSSKVLTFTPDTTPAAGSVVVFSLDASKLTSAGSSEDYAGSKFTSVKVNVPTDVNYVINVVNAAGTTLFGSSVTMSSGTNDTQLLWNVEGTSGTVALGGGAFYGAVLAPDVTISNGSAVVSGQVAAYAFTDTNKALDFASFQNMASVVVPEPAAGAVWGAALCAGAAVARRRLLG